MEHTFDSEDVATFYRSLLLLHSPKIDSQRKLFHIMNQSIRKHHPTKKIPYGRKTAEIPGAESNALKIPDGGKEAASEQMNENEDNFQEPKVKNEPNEQIKPSVSTARDPRSKTQTDNTKSDVKNSGNKCATKTQGSSSSVVNFSLVSGLRSYSSSQPEGVAPQKHPRVAHATNRDSPLLKPTLKASPKTSCKNSYCPNPVNLKKIRAVLARGDPFPTHLTKMCTNNITPDLQREKL